MAKIPSSVLSVSALLVHVITIPLFFLGFVLVYESSWINDFISGGTGDFDRLVFNTLMLTCILVGVLLASRIPVTAKRKEMSFSWWLYICWSLAEITVFCAFAALYMALAVPSYSYFPALGECLHVAVFILPYPYIVFALQIAFLKPNKKAPADDDLVRFSDNTGRLKLVIAHNVLLYIEAQENYVSIHYLEGEKPKEYSLRQSMRGIEDLMDRHGIIRCQRSYFVNPRHVKVLRRDKEGFIQAELDIANTKPVPVSPKYYDQLSELL